jgi:hypothetical protein
MIQFANKSGDSVNWSADVIGGGSFVARVSVSASKGVQKIRLRLFTEESKETGRPNRTVVDEWLSDKGLPRGEDAVFDLVREALSKRGPGRPEIGPTINGQTRGRASD